MWKFNCNYYIIPNDIDSFDTFDPFFISYCFEIRSRITRYQVSRIFSSGFRFYGYFRRIRRGESLCNTNAYFIFKGATPGYNRGSWSCRQCWRRYLFGESSRIFLTNFSSWFMRTVLVPEDTRRGGKSARNFLIATWYFYDILLIDKIRMIYASRFIFLLKLILIRRNKKYASLNFSL